MKILILNGGPRNQGLISQMLDIMTEEARIRGAEVEVLPNRKLQVHPCTVCMACRTRQPCVVPADDAPHTLLPRIPPYIAARHPVPTPALL